MLNITNYLIKTTNKISPYTGQEGVPGGSDGKESTCDKGDLGLIPGLGRSPGGGHDNHSSFIAWRIPLTDELGGLQRIQRVAKNWT